MNDKCLIIITCPSKKNAEKLAKILLEKKLVACVNIIPKVKSLYWWRGKTEESDEAVMFIKTRKNLFNSVEREVLKVHPYAVPEIICVEIKKGLEKYLKWVDEVLR